MYALAKKLKHLMKILSGKTAIEGILCKLFHACLHFQFSTDRGPKLSCSLRSLNCRGHGTQVVDDRLQATVCGVVDRVNKLVTVRPLHRRYAAEIGDVVVGRVTEVRNHKQPHITIQVPRKKFMYRIEEINS